MKRVVVLISAILLLFTSIQCLTEGVVILSAPKTSDETNSVSLDDIKPGDKIELKNAILLFGDFSIEDKIKIYGRGGVDSGLEMDYAVFYMDATNLDKSPVSFLKDVEVSVWYNDEYQFGGWAGQFDLDHPYSDQLRDDKNEQFEIAPLYVGHFGFVCPLPNFAVHSDAPLRMVIKLFGEEITYHIRK